MSYLPELRGSLVKAARRAYVDAPEREPHAASRRLLRGGLATALAAAVAVGVAVVAVLGLGHRPAPTGVASSQPVTRIDLRRSAAEALAMVRLPPGAVRSGLVHGTPAQLWSPSSRLGIRNSVDVYGVWRVRERPDRLIQFLETQFQGGLVAGGSGSSESASSGPGGQVVVQQATGALILRVTRNGIWRQLALNAVTLRGGGTALRVDSQAGWVRPRPAAELIPQGVTRIVLSWASASPRRHGTVTITNPVRVKTLVSALNGLPAGGRLCTNGANGVFKFAFEAGNNQQLAIANWAPRCQDVALTIAGHPAVPLRISPAETFGAPFYAQLAELLTSIDRIRRVSGSVTTVHSAEACAVHHGPPTSAASPSAPGAGGVSCASGSRSTTSASAH